MKIDYIKVNGFGKLINKKIDLKDGINIVYGKNESGKSTLQHFIFGTFFGLSKTKTGKELSSFDKYYPWAGLEYSGKIKYELDNGEKYEVFRDFLRKNPVIYDENSNDISLKFQIDKNKGNLFFENQTGVDERVYLDTAIIEQKNVELSKSSQSNIIQKITNIITSGSESISYEKTRDKILKLKNDKIGTDRTSKKPLNMLSDNISKIEKEQFELKNYQFELEDLEKDEKNQILELEKNSYKLNLVKDMKDYLDNSKMQIAEMDFNKRLEEEYDEKIFDLKNKIDIRAKQNIRLEKKSYFPNYIIGIICIICAIVPIVVLKKYLWCIPGIAILLINALYLVLDNIKINRKKKAKLKEIDELQSKIDKEIEILKKTKEEKMFETQVKNERLNVSILKNEERLSEKYHGYIEEIYIEKIFGLDLTELMDLEKEITDRIAEIKMNLNFIGKQKEDIQIRLNKSKLLDNNLELLNKEKDDLNSLNNSFNLALEVLEESFKEMKECVSPDLTTGLNDMISHISNGKYKNIVLDDEKGLCVELENGRFISCDNLSIGTIDQIYLSLRLSVLNDISNERIPIILDEAFAYFDNDRLENLLSFLVSEFDNQIIIFTCSNREENAFNKIGFVDYNKVII